jgi:hypothetical protein
VHVAHAWPAASIWFGIGVPHAIAPAPGQLGQHEPIVSHVLPAGHIVPEPMQ